MLPPPEDPPPPDPPLGGFFDKCLYLQNINLRSNKFEIKDDITADFWMYPYGGEYEVIFSINANYSFSLYRYMGYNYYYISRYHGDDTYVIYNLNSNKLSHVALVSDSSNKELRIYINGNLSVTCPYYIPAGEAFISFGYSYSDNIPSYSYVSELRVSNIVRYTSNFTPPVKSYSVIYTYITYDENGNIYSI